MNQAERGEPVVKLTSRQRVFLARFVELYREKGESIHYSAVAQDLGLSNATAYDMLRLLEGKGLVAFEYEMLKTISGPGRTSILFFPTSMAFELFSRFAEDEPERQEWEEAKQQILESLRGGKTSEYGILLEGMLDSLPQTASPMVTSARVITALLLGVREAELKAGDKSLLGTILRRPTSRISLSLLAGFALSACLAYRARKQFGQKLENYLREYEASLQQLSQQKLVALHQFTGDAWNILKEKSK